MFRKVMVMLLTLIMITVALTGCGGSTPGAGGSAPTLAESSGGESKAEGPVKDTVIMALSADISTLDPHNTTVLIDEAVRLNIYETLLSYYQGEFTPILCESYAISEDGQKYTFNIKKGVKFHNGEELKASDVVFSISRAKEAPSLSANTASIEGLKAIDDYTVEVTLKEPYAPFLIGVCSKICIMNEQATIEAGDAIKNNPVGTGAYKFVKWDAGQQVVLERFEDWHGGLAPIKNAVYTVIGDPSSALMALETKEIDLTYNLPSIAVKDVEKNPELTLQKVRTLGSGYLVYNLEKSPYSDINFRKALNYAIDKKKVVDIALEGNGEISTGLWNKDTVGYSGNVNTYEMDIEKAKEFLSKSSYKGEDLNLVVGSEANKRVAVLIQEDLRKVGININVELMESNAWIDDMKKGNYGLSFIVMTMDADAEMWANAFHSRAVDVLNFSRLKNKDIDEAFDKGKAAQDIKERIVFYDKILQIIKDEAVVVPIYYRVMTPAFSKDLKVERFYPIGYSRVKDMSWK